MSLNNGVSIAQKTVVKLSNTSTMVFQPIAKTLSKCLTTLINISDVQYLQHGEVVHT